MPRRPTDPDIAVMVPASLARIIVSGDAGYRDLDALETCIQCAIASDAVTVQLSRADADTLADALARAAERDNHLANECENAEDQETAAEVRECVSALDRLAAAIAAAAHQTTEDSL